MIKIPPKMCIILYILTTTLAHVYRQGVLLLLTNFASFHVTLLNHVIFSLLDGGIPVGLEAPWLPLGLQAHTMQLVTSDS